MFTSYFGNLKKLKADPEIKIVSISVGNPRWAGSIDKEPRLAPTRAMLKMTSAEYDHLFAEKLASLDPEEVYESLGDNACLMCWEKPGERCHRRWVAEWLEKSLGVVITEYGYDRDKVKLYEQCPSKLDQKNAKRSSQTFFVW